MNNTPLTDLQMLDVQMLHDLLAVMGVRVRRKSESWLMRSLGFFLGAWFRERAWTTIGSRTIWAPDTANLARLDKHEVSVLHELVHIRQARHWPVLFQLSYLLLPVPFFFAWFRWRWEREAYLVNIEYGTHSVEEVVDLLWSKYGWCWPKTAMRKWFLEKTLGG